MKEEDLALALKYFLAWYEFYLEQRPTQIPIIRSDGGDNRAVPAPNMSQQHLTKTRLTVSRRQQHPVALRHQDLSGRVLLAEMFRRWRTHAIQRRSPASRLTDPDVITKFVCRLRQRISGSSDPGCAQEWWGPTDVYGPLQPLSTMNESQPRSQQAARSCLHRQENPAETPAQQPEGVAVSSRGTPSAGAAVTSANPPAQASPLNRAAGVGTDSVDSVDLCAEIMAGHALQLARRRPVPDTGSEAELRRAPHLHSYLMNATSNRRARRPAGPAAGSEPGRPAYQQQLEVRAEQRHARQEQWRRRRLEREAASREAERQRHREAEQAIARERQQQQEELRQRRQRQERLYQRRLRGQQALQQKEALADRVRRRALVGRVFRALVRHVQRSGQLLSAADQWARAALLRRCLLRWRHQRALVAAEREEAAQHWRNTRLAAWALSRWRTYVYQQRLKEQAASDLSQLQRLQAALRTWQASLALARVRRRQQMCRAAQCDVRLTCAGALRRWRRLHDALEQERDIEDRKNRLRRIVREMLPDFQPPVVMADPA